MWEIVLMIESKRIECRNTNSGQLIASLWYVGNCPAKYQREALLVLSIGFGFGLVLRSSSPGMGAQFAIDASLFISVLIGAVGNFDAGDQARILESEGVEIAMARSIESRDSAFLDGAQAQELVQGFSD